MTVSKGAKQIGQKILPLSSNCAWSYLSRPDPGRITYTLHTLRETGQTTVARRITLNLRRQSGKVLRGRVTQRPTVHLAPLQLHLKLSLN